MTTVIDIERAREMLRLANRARVWALTCERNGASMLPGLLREIAADFQRRAYEAPINNNQRRV